MTEQSNKITDPAFSFHHLLRENQKLFSPYLQSVNFFKAYQIFSDHKDLLFSSPVIQNSNIYFIVEYDKIKLIPQKTKIDKDANITFYFRVANKKVIKKTINFLTILHQESPYISCIFGASSYSHYIKLLNKARSRGCYTGTGVVIRYDLSNEETIFVDIMTEDSIVTGVPIFISSILVHKSVSIGNYQKILYIGQSKDISKRISHHEKIQRATSEVHQDKEIFIHCFKFVDYRCYINSDDFLNNDFSDILDEGKIDLLEMALINYFKPQYNDTYLNTDIQKNKKVEQLLRANNYTSLGATVSFDNEFLRYYTESVPVKNSHLIRYDIDT